MGLTPAVQSLLVPKCPLQCGAYSSSPIPTCPEVSTPVWGLLQQSNPYLSRSVHSSVGLTPAVQSLLVLKCPLQCGAYSSSPIPTCPEVSTPVWGLLQQSNPYLSRSVHSSVGLTPAVQSLLVPKCPLQCGAYSSSPIPTCPEVSTPVWGLLQQSNPYLSRSVHSSVGLTPAVQSLLVPKCPLQCGAYSSSPIPTCPEVSTPVWGLLQQSNPYLS